MSESLSPSKFMVLSRGKWDATLPPERIQKAIDDFYGWLDRMVEQGKMQTGSRLGTGSKAVFRDHVIVDGPYGEAKEVVGGYWFIIAHSLDEAAQFAASSPTLACGLFYEIRPLDPEVATAFVVTNETPVGLAIAVPSILEGVLDQ